MSRTKASHFLFDIGGVLLRLDHHRVAARMQALTGLDPLQVQALLYREGLVQRFETGRMQGRQFHEEVCRRISMDLPWDEFLATWNSILGAPLVSDELLASVAGKTRMWIISNTDELHFDFMTRSYAFLRHFEGFFLSHEVGALKPDARIFLHALEKLQAPPSEVLYVDDQEMNVKAAQDLGISAFRFVSQEQFAAALRDSGLL